MAACPGPHNTLCADKVVFCFQLKMMSISRTSTVHYRHGMGHRQYAGQETILEALSPMAKPRYRWAFMFLDASICSKAQFACAWMGKFDGTRLT
jgi:hypothetical protein